eukprot:240142_1
MADILCSGFTRKYCQALPELISVMVPYVIDLFIRFDTCHPSYQSVIGSNKLKITRDILTTQLTPDQQGDEGHFLDDTQNARFLVGSSTEFISGKICWSIHVMRHEEQTFSDRFGVTSDIEHCKQLLSFNDIEIRCPKCVYFTWKDFHPKEIVQGETITIEMDLEQHNLQFKRNGKAMGTIKKLQPDCAYYPVILSRSNRTDYKLLTFKENLEYQDTDQIPFEHN